MPDTPHEVHLSLKDFDRNQLPEAQRDLLGDDFLQAVREHLSKEFIGGSGAAEVVVTGDRIIIRWTANAEAKTLTRQGIEHLKGGDYPKGIATLRVALQRDPGDADAMFNLAMALSDQGGLEESVELLGRLLEKHPSHAHGWVALGVAQARMDRNEDAVSSLRMAVSLNPEDGYSHKNLGAILAQLGRAADALFHLRRAAELLPNDPQCWFNLAVTLEDASELDAADEAYLKVLELDRTGRMGELAERGRTRIAETTFRARGGRFRPDVLAYCLDALRRFEGMPLGEIQAISFEIAMLGTRGLSVNDPAEQYTLRTLPGTFSGLQLLCIQYVGFQRIDPKLDLGFDLSAEYAEALRLSGE